MARQHRNLILAAIWTVAVVAGLALVVYGALLPQSDAAGQAQAESANGGPTMMLVGDSITQGRVGDYTWRYRLYRHLEAAGVKPDFVGPRKDLFAGGPSGNQAYADRAFDTDHDGVWGRKLADAQATIAGEVQVAAPDYLLVLIGFNDMIYGADAPTVEGNLRKFVVNARSVRPSVAIIIGTVLPTSRQSDTPVLGDRINEFNKRVGWVAAQLSTDNSPIAVATTGAEINVKEDLYDGIHPNARGELKIAKAFADTLADRFAIGRPMPRPTLTLPVS